MTMTLQEINTRLANVTAEMGKYECGKVPVSLLCSAQHLAQTKLATLREAEKLDKQVKNVIT